MEQPLASLTVIFLVTLGTSVLGLLGGFVLLWKEAWAVRWARYLVSFAAGSILGAAFLDLLPEAIEHGNDLGATSSFILFGILLFFVLERFLILHHHAHNTGNTDGAHADSSLASARPLIILGDGLHNFLDGAIIAIAFLTDTTTGVVAAFAVVAHELPQEIGDFSVLLHSGMPRRQVLGWNVVSALTSPLGALVGYGAHETFRALEPIFLALIVGAFVYIALADLIPTIKHERRLQPSIVQILLILVGLGLIWQVGALLPHE